MDDPLKEKIRIHRDYESLCKSLAEHVYQLIHNSLAEQDQFTFVLAGGSTPDLFYEQLGSVYKERIPWERVYFFWGDERNVPLEDEESNFKMVNEKLLKRVNVAEKNIIHVHTVPDNVEKTANNYEEKLQLFFNRSLPRFDLVLLGLGEDGHTASLFPRSRAINEEKRWVVPSEAPDPPRQRVTMTYPVINNAKNIYFLVNGKEKAAAVNNAFNDDIGKNICPAAYIQPGKGKLLWWLDKEAALNIQHKGIW
jgi:6-phosphogluconolactonase